VHDDVVQVSQVAVGVIAELGDLTRFDHPRKLMSYLGLVPGEHSSGGKRRQGAITKCGNSSLVAILMIQYYIKHKPLSFILWHFHPLQLFDQLHNLKNQRPEKELYLLLHLEDPRDPFLF